MTRHTDPYLTPVDQPRPHPGEPRIPRDDILAVILHDHFRAFAAGDEARRAELDTAFRALCRAWPDEPLATPARRALRLPGATVLRHPATTIGE